MPDVLMDYDAMQDLISQADLMAQTFDDMSKACESAAGKIEDGGLVNQQGQQWVEELRNRIIPYLRQQIETYEELARDLQGALVDMRDGDTEARSRFSG